jgi:glycosyltransferase involved in cell wall biosynthesis
MVSGKSSARATRRRQRGGAAAVATAAATATALPKTLFRLHVLAVPHTITRKDYSGCAYTDNVLNFCKMMTRRGHTVIHYGHEDSKVECTEHVTVMRDSDLKEAYGMFDWKKDLLPHKVGDLANRTFNERAVTAIKERRAPPNKPEILLLFWGIGHKDVAAAYPDMMAVDPGLGCFNAPAVDHTVYVSYALASHITGKTGVDPRPEDAVIPNYFDVADARFSAKPASGKPYFMFIGRLIKSKGLDTAVAVAKATGIPLKIAGQGDLAAALGAAAAPPGLIQHVGYLEPAARTQLLGGAIALLAPSHYDEPFGKVVIEAGLCGTPVITSDWGGFSEIVLHGWTGYRCRTEEQFAAAAKEVVAGKIDRRICYAWASKNFSLEKVAPMFEAYFKRISVGGSSSSSAAAEDLLCWQREYPPFK